MGTRYRGSGRDFIFAWELLLKLSTNIPIFFPYRTINTKYFKKRKCSVSILMMICGWKCPHLEKYFIFSLFFDVFGVLFLGDSSSRENFMEDGYTTHWEEVEILHFPYHTF